MTPIFSKSMNGWPAMHISGMVRRIAESHTGVKRGFVILNCFGGLWDERLYPSISAAMREIQRTRFGSGYRIVPAKRIFDWRGRGRARDSRHPPDRAETNLRSARFMGGAVTGSRSETGNRPTPSLPAQKEHRT